MSTENKHAADEWIDGQHPEENGVYLVINQPGDVLLLTHIDGMWLVDEGEEIDIHPIRYAKVNVETPISSLNACRECGSKGVIIGNGFTFFVKCEQCDYRTHYYEYFQDAIEEWNEEELIL